VEGKIFMNKRKVRHEQKLVSAITNMIDEGSEEVTTLSEDTEAKYESIAEKVPGEEQQ
jgi:biopolymer transport protein ExbD